MLTKEFAQRVELSEKQVRKIVQHLEERGYQLSKTEYRGREATDFKEEDIELFQDIAEKVKQTNSYDLAFDELEQEKDFLQVLVKDDSSNLPTNQNISQVVEELRGEIQQIREERHMLGQMISQVHNQQNELRELQNQITAKLDTNTEALKTIQASTDKIKTTQAEIHKTQSEQAALIQTSVANDTESSRPQSNQSSEQIQATEDKATTNHTKQAEPQSNNATVNHNNQSEPKATEEEFTQVDSQIAETDASSNEEISKPGVQEDTTDSSKTSEQEITQIPSTEDTSQTIDNNENNHSTESSSEEINDSEYSTASQSSPLTKETPSSEKKGFFARLFNL